MQHPHGGEGDDGYVDSASIITIAVVIVLLRFGRAGLCVKVRPFSAQVFDCPLLSSAGREQKLEKVDELRSCFI